MSRLGNIGGRLYRGEVSVDFVGRKKLWYLISGAILVISIAAMLFRGLNYSVEFKGGVVYQFAAPAATTTQVTSTVTAAGGGANPIVQQIDGNTKWQVQTSVLSTAMQFNVQDKIAAKFGLQHSAVSLNSVGPSWGSQISQKALEALIAFLIVIVIYLSVAFEWRMSAAALVALAHDIVITIGIYALTGFEVSPASVIGLLTILGYSLYDTVVVFDKVRENTAGLLTTRRTSYSDAANLALNQTLVRSINTSLIALLPVISILAVSAFLLGNGELKDLSLVLFVGMLSGTYSSICIATPVLADLKEREPEYKQLRKQIAQRSGSAKRKAKVTSAATQVTVTTATIEADLQDGSDGSADEAAGPGEDQPGIPVAATRPSGASSGSRPVTSGPRQQPRRQGASQRRPSGKKKRR
jgi:preprotein translocase subunit SecF